MYKILGPTMDPRYWEIGEVMHVIYDDLKNLFVARFHYEGFDLRFDEWIPTDSPRIVSMTDFGFGFGSLMTSKLCPSKFENRVRRGFC